MAAALLRSAGLLAVWIVIGGADPKDLAVGIPTAAIATWFSLRLLPAGMFRPRPLALAGLLLRFPVQALLAGTEVARRAFDLRVQPGLVRYVRISPSPRRDAFLTWASLQPGTLPAGEDEATGAVLVHALDTSQLVHDSMVIEEARFTRAFGG
ncbi:Na+/H+ antiporter subunit E [Roseococcus sp. SYP-B2431]|uniref:Na+/H+ antiporter subunit E n=1 Tax=Roseococcus sp. SYP-B2431 TaxID=2496640 RepID=UPI0019818B5A|nr:Na+/H+ antiporter subunit E [Roseococcus sp. SYP-B2431]